MIVMKHGRKISKYGSVLSAKDYNARLFREYFKNLSWRDKIRAMEVCEQNQGTYLSDEEFLQKIKEMP